MKFCLAIFFLTLMSLEGVFAKESVLRVRADDWCPYNCHPRSVNRGHLIELLDGWAAKEKLSVDYQLVPWSRALLDTRAGYNEVIVGVSTADAEGMNMSIPLAEDKTCFFTAGSKWTYRKPSDLNKLKSLGMAQDYIWPNLVIEWVNENPFKVQKATGERPLEANIKKLVGGRVEALIENSDVVKYYRRLDPESEVVKESGCLKPFTIHIAFTKRNKNSQHWKKSFDRYVLELKKNGELDRIVQKYGVNHLVK